MVKNQKNLKEDINHDDSNGEIEGSTPNNSASEEDIERGKPHQKEKVKSPFPMKHRLIIAIGYAIPMIVSVTYLPIIIVFIYYYFLGSMSRFVNHHLKQCFNVIVNYYIYWTAFTSVIYLIGTYADTFEQSEPLIESNPVLGAFLFLFLMSDLFLLIFLNFLLHVTLIITIVLAFLGRWARIPLIIRFIK
ncbi:hypothetical protein [Texcoconibacillus texcoconensis]|uniref:Putative Tic20 family protein n=1 Tax=Texcoconibacillus texcoconensis TaxID=1095777 RepID=A0A840QMD4_9BACI|nr:hypothetical protein [Texcoconibacillus texcoconensis]MBB5172528.1 putative Tic20 family protein [Texcoconibacillus texcoconensis]